MKTIQTEVKPQFSVIINAPREQLKNFVTPEQFQDGAYYEIIYAGTFEQAFSAVCCFCENQKIYPASIQISKV